MVGQRIGRKIWGHGWDDVRARFLVSKNWSPPMRLGSTTTRLVNAVNAATKGRRWRAIRCDAKSRSLASPRFIFLGSVFCLGSVDHIACCAVSDLILPNPPTTQPATTLPHRPVGCSIRTCLPRIGQGRKGTLSSGGGAT